jgi:MOSC domain-containing protein YiiM
MPNLPVLEGILGVEGFAGDGWNNRKLHGGPLQAVLLVAMETLDHLRAEGFPVFPGAIGENITTQGIPFAALRPGMRFQVGEAVIELTKIRTPCAKLDVFGPGIQQQVHDAQVKRGDTSSPCWGRSGFYAKVLHPGVVRALDPITLLSASPDLEVGASTA